MGTKEILDRLVEEEKNKQYGEEVVCPYCKAEQNEETRSELVSYWGEGKELITCEECDKEFWVEEIVVRNFETTTTEWIKKEEERINKMIEDKKEKENGN